ncbi:MAG: SDR family NAD(P)-dependent oxidoreductase [Cellulomonas iranensis]|uniref:SDR family NAD(P)-dependent oxidoreductase n=1 Tax=Cellulomonas iranensis TaxID=76862 RepID=UPI001B204D99|nr:SDR family NAD(P)-dependent oxidoreductase [Cellulomonas iranensis]MBO9568472.1 SDR family NAD(P)-dependent oxidoreductase [Cellulomonas iranensis]
MPASTTPRATAAAPSRGPVPRRASTAAATAWDPHHLPDQTGRTVVVTGGSAGIGYFIAEQLAGAGAHVVLAARDADRAAAAQSAITAQHPAALTSVLPLDLASLDSVRRAADAIANLDRVDALVLNAAVMVLRTAGAATADGFDPVMGTGHLGNAALVAHALPVLARTPGARVVGTTSGLVRRFHPAIGDLAAASRPLPSARPLTVGRRYVLSKAVHEAFFAELDRHLRATGSSTLALLSHPGVAIGSRSPLRPGVLDPRKADRGVEPLWGLIGAGKDAGAWSAVRAAADPHVESGQYWGPAGRVTGLPVLGAGDPRYREPALGRRVREETEALIGVRLP